ncbi:MAG: LytTR family transcriptional regulator DNA-binding domain-containing protein [Liquorilactobacillus nagelii]|uniref:DNA-binding response regulator n=3 Tax=Liquorilactobacillus nagelii TaxID=82688 RepID=A0A3Q8CPT6_9LACO|nr:LytTR family transcriptional regulator DNA-binding domain-containing protein [Liquorilactobacillus nagelii]AUJ32842.1 DNA-binding response regulator [Liquorilactobacillus nagelii]MCC7616415.1 DNA-binding response regulator [Liquorilactobacillus nagelii]MCP9315173.1 LytTR family transcriptional regulator DNA-binding domain-containing protein [Liquorilactobacillus nagelii]
MNVLLVDDEPLSRNELEYLLKQNSSVEQIYQADGIAAGLQLLLKNQIELLFLDIELNDENGFSLAKELQQLTQPPLVIFATAYDNYAVDAFNINAIDYVLKPFEQDRINQAVAKAGALLADKSIPTSPTEPDYPTVITVTQEEKTTVVPTKEIISAAVNNGVLTITTVDDEFSAHETLNWLKQRLNPQQFIQVHRSVLVNLNCIREVQPWFNHTYQLTMTNQQKLPVGRSFIKPLRQKLQM